MLRDALIFLSDNARARHIAMKAPGARSVARRFVAGETLDEGLDASRTLVENGFFVTLDYLGESVDSREEARAAADLYVRMLSRIGADAKLREHVNVSLKLTQMGQDIRLPSTGAGAGDSNGTAAGAWPRPTAGAATPESTGGYDDELLLDNVKRILDTARDHDIFVRLDMEGTPHTQRTLDFFRALWDSGYRNIGVVLQSYLRRAGHDVQQANLLGARVRLCKGAYNEPEEYAFQPKSEVDANYIALMKTLLSDGTYPGIATHDPAMIDATRAYSRARDLPPSGWEFQMLYGIRRDLQHQLRSAGYNLRVYVPFGEAWYPYLMRRMAERPANLMFIVGSLWREMRGGRSRK
ncbi:MAG: proline dehydrogenase family protein [Gemmatimonadota bacterium]